MSNYDKFAEKIKSEEFRSSMKKFIDENCERYFKDGVEKTKIFDEFTDLVKKKVEEIFNNLQIKENRSKFLKECLKKKNKENLKYFKQLKIIYDKPNMTYFDRMMNIRNQQKEEEKKNKELFDIKDSHLEEIKEEKKEEKKKKNFFDIKDSHLEEIKEEIKEENKEEEKNKKLFDIKESHLEEEKEEKNEEKNIKKPFNIKDSNLVESSIVFLKNKNEQDNNTNFLFESKTIDLNNTKFEEKNNEKEDLNGNDNKAQLNANHSMENENFKSLLKLSNLNIDEMNDIIPNNNENENNNINNNISVNNNFEDKKVISNKKNSLINDSNILQSINLYNYKDTNNNEDSLLFQSKIAINNLEKEDNKKILENNKLGDNKISVISNQNNNQNNNNEYVTESQIMDFNDLGIKNSNKIEDNKVGSSDKVENSNDNNKTNEFEKKQEENFEEDLIDDDNIVGINQLLSSKIPGVSLRQNLI